MAEIFWWVVFPYIALTVMIVGLLYRFAYRQTSWAAPSTEMFEKKWLRVGSTLFHWGIIFALVGHIMGVLIPRGVYEALGVTDELYHVFAIAGGGVAGIMVVLGLIVLLIRRWTNRRLRVHSRFSSYFTVIWLLIVAVMGVYMTLIYNVTVGAYEYRTTIGPWFRSLFTFQPAYELMREVPVLFRVHIIFAFVLFASIPFTVLVHMFSFPIRYPTRAPQQYRSRWNYRRKSKI
ncbi:respiratory nitrate reductase subunit gamma [Paenibacillus selenitireducens]|uniref:Respiratory nitrate reductase subunit gamma n=1 Tax=Paenibacillus selenitireducens TaxID=1324314 RepID=A0A1T2X194_9BACL|nr:respiratory nitrate reductase subunit gamma [Paenibacillus selenitireducens]OPA73333.1 respiratory nitrate reductase subunit gamma [Paenibacillus selenitireducens]